MDDGSGSISALQVEFWRCPYVLQPAAGWNSDVLCRKPAERVWLLKPDVPGLGTDALLGPAIWRCPEHEWVPGPDGFIEAWLRNYVPEPAATANAKLKEFQDARRVLTALETRRLPACPGRSNGKHSAYRRANGSVFCSLCGLDL